MSLDITPLVPAGKQLIQRYGDGGFRVAGEDFTGSVIVLSDETTAWDVENVDQLSTESLTAIFAATPQAEIILIGCGSKFTAPPKQLRTDLKEKGISLEWMDTGAACRTFNVLLTEERSVAAALIAID
jgi:uncharacterized protein